MDDFELDGRSIENPVFCSHRRGRNWAAVVSGKNAANAQRNFLKAVGRTVDLSQVAVGDVVEFGGDYISSGGIRRPNRCWWLIVKISDEVVSVDPFESLAAAMRAARAKPVEEGRIDG